MATTVLSSKGQIIIPNPIRTVHRWEPGQRFEAIDTGNGVLLKPASPFPKTDIEEVASCLPYSGSAKTLADMDKAVRQSAEESNHDRR